jgi:flagellar hook-associated protein 3 FlgL
MRVTQNTISNHVLENLQVIQQRQDQLEQESSTGLKVSAIGDDPITSQQILKLKSQTAQSNQYARNITSGTSMLTMATSAMSSMTNTLTSLKQLAIQMSTATNNDSARAAGVLQLQQMKSQMVALGNTQLNGKYIFGGFKNDTPPFDATTGAFTGTTDATSLEIAPGSSVPVTYSGGTLIAGAGGGTDIMGIFDNLIAAVGSGNLTAVQGQLGAIDSAATQITSAQAVVGASMNRLSTASSVASDMNIATSQVLSSIQDADFTQVVSDLSKQQTAYQAAIAASAKISQVSLLDYLK